MSIGGLDIRRDRVMIDIACNDPDNGVFAGRAEMVSVGCQFLELQALREPAPKLVEIPGGIRMAGKEWPIAGSKYGIGNWCWNGYWMAIPDAVEFLCWLKKRGFYSCDKGETRIFNLWQLDKPFDDDTKRYLKRMLGKSSTWRSA